MPTGPIGCLVVDDHPAMLAAVRAGLAQNGVTVVADADSVAGAIAALAETTPDVAVVDLRLPDGSGFDVAAEALRSGRTHVVLYSADADAAVVADGIALGIHGFVRKESPIGSLVRAIREATRGRRYVDPAITSELIDAAPPLSGRERTILIGLSNGLGQAEIAAELGVTVATVQRDVVRARAKLAAPTVAAAVAVALRRALID